MKHIIFVVLGLIWADVMFAQINIVDKGDVFEVYATGQFRSSSPKGLAYINMDAQGRLGLLRAANGSQITSYANIAAYRVNGVQYGTLEELVAALQVAIFVLPCLSEDTTCTYSVEGINLEAFACVTFDEGFALYKIDFFEFKQVANNLAVLNFNEEEFNSISDLLDYVESEMEFFNTANLNYQIVFERLQNGFCLKTDGIVPLGAMTVINIGGGNGIIVSDNLSETNPNPLGVNWYFKGNAFETAGSIPENYVFNSTSPYTFQVNINGTWTNQTPVNGTWSLTTDDTVTEWRIIDADSNVIDSDTLICNQ